mmetsp:Transcript_65294/g.96565  ORF Transcript_65294/g.96565 Transcript_65294/m.96565 type:complete len:236 (-) Transcript_65294:495-1202(-)
MSCDGKTVVFEFFPFEQFQNFLRRYIPKIVCHLSHTFVCFPMAKITTHTLHINQGPRNRERSTKSYDNRFRFTVDRNEMTKHFHGSTFTNMNEFNIFLCNTSVEGNCLLFTLQNFTCSRSIQCTSNHIYAISGCGKPHNSRSICNLLLNILLSALFDAVISISYIDFLNIIQNLEVAKKTTPHQWLRYTFTQFRIYARDFQVSSKLRERFYPSFHLTWICYGADDVKSDTEHECN